jgi:hypothetical protein
MIVSAMTTRIGTVPNIYCSYNDFIGCGEWNAAKDAYDVHVPTLRDFGFTVKGETDFPAKMKRHVERHLAAHQGERQEFVALISETTDGFVGFIPDIGSLLVYESTFDELRYGLAISAQGYMATFKRKKFRSSTLSEIRQSKAYARHREMMPVILVLEV